jgi:6-phosphogluconolactonase
MNSPRTLRNWVLAILAIAAVTCAAGGTSTTAQTKPGPASRSGKVVLYTGIGPALTLYDVDVDAATLTERVAVRLPGAVTEAAITPSKKYMYAIWGDVTVKPPTHGISAFEIDPVSGVLTPHGKSVPLPTGPGYAVYASLDLPVRHIMAAVTDPADLTVYELNPDGTLGSAVRQAATLDFGNHPHQVRLDPKGETAILVTRGDAPTANRAENPGALKLFSYKNGQLANTQTVAPNKGYGYQARHVDFHPSGKWDFVTLEAQQKLLVYRRHADGTLDPESLFSKDTLENPGRVQQGQILGTVRVHPNGRFLYVVNRASGAMDFEGKPVFRGGENTIVVFAINQTTGEPTKIQSIDTHGLHARTIAFDPSTKLLVAYNIQQRSVRNESGQGVHVVAPNLTVFRVGDDGKLTFVRTYDVAVGNGQDWMGMTSLPR